MPAKSKLGQNFLNDIRAIERIAEAMGPLDARTAVEIGPGQGAITQELISRARHVVAVEVDPHLALRLRVRFGDQVLSVVEQDVLKFDFTALSQQLGERLAVAGNLPYYITSPILHHLAEHHRVLDHAILMVQKEVAERVTADPGSSDYGVLSVTTQLYGPVSRLFDLPPEAFNPPPKVHSSVFRWRFAPRIEELGIHEASFITFVKQAFAQKRKTLANNLRAAKLENDAIHDAISSCSINEKARAEDLTLDEFAALWRALSASNSLPVA